MSADVLTLTVPGISCGHCEAAVTAELTKVVGVTGVKVDLAAKLVTVTGAALDRDAVVEAIDAAGYDVQN